MTYEYMQMKERKWSMLCINLREGDSTYLNIWMADNSTLVESFKIVMDQRTT